MLNIDSLDWDKMDGLIPAIVQDAFDGRVLMQAYVNREALARTLDSRRASFWSRSRQSLWTKGETSGNWLEVESVHADCDGDCVLILACPSGPCCHLGTETCFDGRGAVRPKLAFLSRLEAIIAQRDAERPEGSYTTKLFESGSKRMAQKVGEEGVETALAAVSGDSAEFIEESADLVYHLMVLLRAFDSELGDLLKKLEERHSA